MNRTLWQRGMRKEYCPPWPCPICNKGTLSLVPKSLIHHETAKSKHQRKYDGAWGPEYLDYVFSAWAKCSDQSCAQQFAISGHGGVEPSYATDGSTEYDDYFYPLRIDPMPNVIDIPKSCPAEVADELREAFELMLGHPASCAARIRVAIERLLDHIGVERHEKAKPDKLIELTLHRRIAKFTAGNAVTGAQLMVIKWFGNSGSHTATIGRAELLDAFEIFEHVLVEVLEKRSEKIAAMTAKLAKKHVPKRD